MCDTYRVVLNFFEYLQQYMAIFAYKFFVFLFFYVDNSTRNTLTSIWKFVLQITTISGADACNFIFMLCWDEKVKLYDKINIIYILSSYYIEQKKCKVFNLVAFEKHEKN